MDEFVVMIIGSYLLTLVAGAFLHYRFGFKVWREINRVVDQGEDAAKGVRDTFKKL